MGNKHINEIMKIGGGWEEDLDNDFNFKDTELDWSCPVIAINRIRNSEQKQSQRKHSN